MPTYGFNQAQLESAVGTAHAKVFRAYVVAQEQGLEDLAEDLYNLAGELSHIGNSLIANSHPTRARYQGRLPNPDR